MDDHYEILRRAVANIPDAERRRALYGRARAVLAEQVRAAVPPLPDATVSSHRTALEAAIERLEREWEERVPRRPVGPLEISDIPTSVRKLPASMWLIAAIAVLLVGAGGLLAMTLLRGSPKPPPSQVANKVISPETDSRVEIDDRTAAVNVSADPSRAFTYGRQLTYYRTTQPAGSMIIDMGQRFLYLIRPNNSAVRYGIGIGRECLDLPTPMRVTRKMAAQPGSKDEVSLGPRQVFLDNDSRSIHGTSRPDTIGRLVWLGCIRLKNEDVIDLYDHAALGGLVVVTD